jgi:hypothetical protein
MSEINIQEMQERIQDIIKNEKNWSEDLVSGTTRFLEYTSRIGQVFLEINNEVLTDLLNQEDQREMVREFLLDPNKIYLILVKSTHSLFALLIYS